MRDNYSWSKIQDIPTKRFKCGFCTEDVSPHTGFICNYTHEPHRNESRLYIYICHACGRPNFFDISNVQYPNPTYGSSVSGVTDTAVESIYLEARKTYGAGAYTASVMCCRALLMHVAVAQGAAKTEQQIRKLDFKKCIQFFVDKRLVPHEADKWLEKVRKAGNDANHKIMLFDAETAKALLGFSEMLLRLVYEFPAKAQELS